MVRLAFVSLIALALWGCQTTDYPLEAAAELPAAEGTLEVDPKKAGSSEIKLEAKHLAQPAKVAPGATTYVVWVQPGYGDARPYNIGQLKMNKDQEGEFEGTVPYQVFNVFVTAEPSANVTVPSGVRVLSSQQVRLIGE